VGQVCFSIEGPIAFIPEQSDRWRMQRHRAIIRILKAWAWRCNDPTYRVPLSDALADDVIETVIQNDLLRHFDPPDDPEALNRRALDRAQRRRRPRSHA
jgi:hypothetical protein